MAEFKLGRIRFVWKGAWAASTTYYKDDIVRHGGRTYYCSVGHTSTTLFTTDEDPEPKGVPILSIVGLLNNDFTGGEFIIGEKTINLNQGDIVMFPSNFIYPHRVATINNGERYSFVSWVW